MKHKFRLEKAELDQLGKLFVAPNKTPEQKQWLQGITRIMHDDYPQIRFSNALTSYRALVIAGALISLAVTNRTDWRSAPDLIAVLLGFAVITVVCTVGLWLVLLIAHILACLYVRCTITRDQEALQGFQQFLSPQLYSKFEERVFVKKVQCGFRFERKASSEETK